MNVFALLGRKPEAIADKVCVLCNKPATEFKDELSKKEYLISAMCQQCQDEVFDAKGGR